MIEPFLSGDALLADVVAAGKVPGALNLWWLGQSGFLVQWAGRHLLVDPYLSDSLTAKYAATDKPHVRMTGRAIEPERLGFVDVVASTHNHTDHFDPDTLRPVMAARKLSAEKGTVPFFSATVAATVPAEKGDSPRQFSANANLTLVVPEANREVAVERLAVAESVTDRPLPNGRGSNRAQSGAHRAAAERLRGIDDGETVDVAGFSITAVPAAHETIERDEAGRLRFLGYIIRCGAWTIYHAGDTVLFDGMVERLAPWGIDVALLPINGRDPARRVAGNLWGREAAWLARQIGAKVAIPCHYEMFEFNTASPDEFVAECGRLGQACRVLRCGERWTGM